MATGTLKIHSENILPIIKKWLYSEKDIFVRELVSNACDAIAKLKILREKGETRARDEEFRIDVRIDKEARTLCFSDTGLGMDATEVETYIAQLAFSGAEDFIAKYSSEKEGDQIIGHFGLGFYSAYMVASRVDIQTRSYREEAQPVFWSCDGSSQYTLDVGSRDRRGTDILLHLAADESEYLETERLERILNHYCSFLPFPIYLNDKRLNEEEPLWMKLPSECTKKDYLAFYRHLYPSEPEPLFWVHLNVDFPFHLKGILYFPKLRRDFDFSRNAIKLFCNRVFVSDDCKDLIPEYLTVLRGAIDSPDIPLNVSRSYLQVDRTVRQVGTHISKKISDRLVGLLQLERENFLAAWPDLEVICKLGAMQDDKFYDRVKECLIFKSTSGEWTTVEGYLERNREKHDGRVFYAGDERHQPPFLKLYREKGIEVLYMSSSLDTHLVSFLERKLAGVKFQRIDGAIDDAIVDHVREKTVLDAGGKTEGTRLAEYVKSVIGVVDVEAKSLASESLPAFLVLDEHSRRLRDYLVASETKGHLPEDFDRRKLVVNTNSRLMTAIQSLKDKKPDLAKDLCWQVYDMALLGQREMKPEALDAFIHRTNDVLEKLAEAL